MDLLYEVTGSEKVKLSESELKRDLVELRNEIEENEMVHQIMHPISSVLVPRDVSFFKHLREHAIKRSTNISKARQITIQADLMQEELEGCHRMEYTSDSLPLLLHHHFSSRLQHLVQLKHLHMLRWRRFCEHTKVVEQVYPYYQKRLSEIMDEYNDCMGRAQRLEVSHEGALTGNHSAGMMAVKMEDVMIYLRWLTSHFHAIKHFNQFMRLLEWLPLLHKTSYLIDNKSGRNDRVDDMQTARIPSRYNENSFLTRPSSSVSHSESTALSDSSREPISTVPIPLSPVNEKFGVNDDEFTYSASGGGIAADEEFLQLPLHVNEIEQLKPQLDFFVKIYAINYDVKNISSTSDEMELYAQVTRKFKPIFTRQEHLNTFKTYDFVDHGKENWGSDHSMHALLQESNWLPFTKLVAEKDPDYQKMLVKLKTKKNIDELLKSHSKFILVSDHTRVQESFKAFCLSIREPPNIQPVSVTTNKTQKSSNSIWKQIYANPDLYDKKEYDREIREEIDEKDIEKVDIRHSGKHNAAQHEESYEFMNTIQLLGLDEGDQASTDPSSIQGGFLSFLFLRHLRLRDLSRTCLSIFNYFRSIERTLTINDGGLSLEEGTVKNNRTPDHRKIPKSGFVGGSGGICSHSYMHNSPLDFKISESSFMEFADVENHDDFFVHDEGRVHVRDQRGFFIIYDSALKDLRKLEEEMLYVGSHYIEKDKDLRTACKIKRVFSTQTQKDNQAAGDFNIGSYAHQEVDRMGVLLDLWAEECAFMEAKKQLIDCYLEAYYHIIDRDEKRNIAQILTNLIYQRPRLDFQDAYFLKSYRQETAQLLLYADLVKSILDQQIDEQRHYLDRISQSGVCQYGFPSKVIEKQLISINMSRPALKNIYLLEFHPSLSFISRLPIVLKQVFNEVNLIQPSQSTIERVMQEKKILELSLKEWRKMVPMGHSFSHQVQKDLFSDVYVEDPLFMSGLAQKASFEQDQKLSRKSQKDRQVANLTCLCKFLEIITIRYRLIDSAWESEILSQIYRRQAVEMGYDECHLFQRFVQFEFASLKENASRPPPIFISSVHEDDYGLDRFIPNHNYLGVHELDESHIGRFSFHSGEAILEMIKNQGLETMQTVLACQIVHKNSLISAVQQAHHCLPGQELNLMKRPLSPNDTKSEKSSATIMTGISSGTQMSQLLANQRQVGLMMSRSPEAFVSLQLEKAPSRDLMLNEFINKKAQMETILKNPVEVERLKRKLITEYCHRFNHRVCQYSLRGQIIACYSSILALLQNFTNIRDTYFVIGEPNEKKSQFDDVEGLSSEMHSSKLLQRRPRRVLSSDGNYLLNIWFIPHHSESLIMYKTLEEKECRRALTKHLLIVAYLHEILQYLCAHAKMGAGTAFLGDRTSSQFVPADWGGTEGIGSELRDIQRQINNLGDKRDLKRCPNEVSDFLRLRRDVMFLQFDCAVRYSISHTFLRMENKPAYQAISNCTLSAMEGLSNITQMNAMATLLPIPEPLEPWDTHAWMLYPWRSFINRHGPFSLHLGVNWRNISDLMCSCLSQLRDSERSTAHGEILGVSLLMEDVLLSGRQEQAIYAGNDPSDDDTDDEDNPITGRVTAASLTSDLHLHPDTRSELASQSEAALLSRPSTAISTRTAGTAATSKNDAKRLSRTTEPVESYKLLYTFLVLWKRVEILKECWGKKKLKLENIDTVSSFKNFTAEYCKDILLPITLSVARHHGQAEIYEHLLQSGSLLKGNELGTPRGATEIEMLSRQLIRLLEYLECGMIQDVQRRLSKELNLVLSERAREENALPTDLWKKPVMKESFTINRPQIVESFISQLLTEYTETSEGFLFSENHLNNCLFQLASEVTAREKSNYENYSMYYENLLRSQHQLLYQKEQEMKSLQDHVAVAQLNSSVDVRCSLAEENSSLLLEVTALRAKIAEMRELSLTTERDLRERMRDEYTELVHALFNACFELQQKFDEFREELYDEVHQNIEFTRVIAEESVGELKQKSNTDKDEKCIELQYSQKLQELRHENSSLNVIISKMKTLSQWKNSFKKCQDYKITSSLKKSAEFNSKKYTELKMIAEQEIITHRQQIVALQKSLKKSQANIDFLKKQLESEINTEIQEKKEKLHASQQHAHSRKQLEEARRTNVEKLTDELEVKNAQLKTLQEVHEKNSRVQQLTAEKVHKEKKQIQRKLEHERNLKLAAFQRVDGLQNQVNDYENISVALSRPNTAVESYRPRSGSSSCARRSQSRITGGGSIGCPSSVSAITWPAQNPPHSSEARDSKSSTGRKVQRPKTSMARLRSKIADQLVTELENSAQNSQSPPLTHQEMILKLQEIRQQKNERSVFLTN